MKILRTPEKRFRDLPDFAYTPHFADVGDGLRLAYVDEGPPEGPTVVLLHGEPSWSFLYRKMIPPLRSAGFRVLAPDLIGFGRSDKPGAVGDYSFQRHMDWMTRWLVHTGARDATLFAQDWGSLIGLRLIAEAEGGRFARVAIGNGGLPDGSAEPPKAFVIWRAFSRWSPVFPIGEIVHRGTYAGLSPMAKAAYDAPFSGRGLKAGARAFPALVPFSPDDPANEAVRQAWAVLERWDKPFLTTFSNKDPITRGGARILQKRIPGTKDQNHVTIRDAGHFLQEDKGQELAEVLISFVGGG